MSQTISVIVPVYKTEQYLRRCLDSVIAQTYKDLEIICINDGSPDNSLSILREYAANDARIKIIDQKNGGLSAARNAGLDAASGRYFMFVDSDDLIKPDMMQIMWSTLTKYDADMVNCQFDNYYSEDNIKGRGYSHPPVVKDTKEAILLLLKDSQITNHIVRNIVKKELFQDIRFPVGRLYEDVIVTPQLFLKSRKTVFICDELYHYYSNDNSIVHTQTYDNQKQSTMAFIQAFETIEKNIPAYIDDYSGIFCKKMIHHHHSILTYRTKDNENYIFARHIENILKRFLTIKFFKKHPLIFIRIFLMRIKKCYITNTRFIRIGIYKLLAAVNSKKKKRYLEKIEKES